MARQYIYEKCPLNPLQKDILRVKDRIRLDIDSIDPTYPQAVYEEKALIEAMHKEPDIVQKLKDEIEIREKRLVNDTELQIICDMAIRYVDLVSRNEFDTEKSLSELCWEKEKENKDE